MGGGGEGGGGSGGSWLGVLGRRRLVGMLRRNEGWLGCEKLFKEIFFKFIKK